MRPDWIAAAPDRIGGAEPVGAPTLVLVGDNGVQIVLEIAENQAANVAELLRHLGYERLTISPDMAGRDRVIEAQWSR